jgi:hypothetical protein
MVILKTIQNDAAKSLAASVKLKLQQLSDMGRPMKLTRLSVLSTACAALTACGGGGSSGGGGVSPIAQPDAVADA